MIDPLLIEDLACSPPQLWSQLIQRAEVLRPLAQETRLDAAQVNQAMLAMGVKRRRFYDLLERHRARHRGAEPSGPQTGLTYHLEAAAENIIAQALRLADPEARQGEVFRLAMRLSSERGLSPPSETSVRTRWARARAGNRFRQRLQITCDFVADLCALELCVQNEAGLEVPAYLMAMIDCATGRPVHHALFAGEPETSAIGTSIVEYLRRRADALPKHATLGLSSAFPEEDAHKLRCVNWWSVVPATVKRKVTAGLPLRTSVGHWLGRIRLRADIASWREPVNYAPVPLEIAAAVVRHLLEGGQEDCSPSFANIALCSSNMASTD